MDRRGLLKAGMLAGASGLCNVSLLRAGAAGNDDVEIIRLTDELAVIAGLGANVVVLDGEGDRLLLVNGGAAKHARRLLGQIDREWPQRNVEVLFNTCWHFGETGLNELLGPSGVRIIAHENTRLWLSGDFYVPWQDRHHRPRPADALPTDTFYTEGGLDFGKQPVRYGHLPRAHTDGDIYVLFPAANVLVAGGTLAVGRYPMLDYATGGWLGGMIEANEKLLALADENTWIVPAYGPPQTRTDLALQYDMLTTMMERLVDMLRSGMSAQDMLAASATQEFDARWGDPELFVRQAYQGLWAHVHSLGGIL